MSSAEKFPAASPSVIRAIQKAIYEAVVKAAPEHLLPYLGVYKLPIDQTVVNVLTNCAPELRTVAYFASVAGTICGMMGNAMSPEDCKVLSQKIEGYLPQR
jgi:ApbE superfamily uncharacterized protein (UPF0280 family)